jgi:predicted restriction endonuclease
VSDLSSVNAQSLHQLLSDIDNLHRGGSKAEPKPHKLLMLLAVIDLIDRGILTENRITYDETLRETFANFFRLVYDSSDWCQPGPPFFHLRTSGFWNHEILNGREVQYSKLTTSGGGNKRIEDNIEYAYLSDSAYSIFQNAETRRILRTHISEILNPNRSQ